MASNMNRNGTGTLSFAQQFPISRGLTATDVCVNSGEVKEDEIPLWVGESYVADEMKLRMRASMTIGRDWLWVRTIRKPHAKHIKWFRDHSYTYSGQRNGWHTQLSVGSLQLAQTIIKDGFKLDVAAILAVSTQAVDLWTKHSETVKAEKDAKKLAQLSGRTTVDHVGSNAAHATILLANASGVTVEQYNLGLHRNKAGRLVDKNGHFVSEPKGSVKKARAQANDLPSVEDVPAPSGHVTIGETLATTVVDTPVSDEQAAYELALTITAILDTDEYTKLPDEVKVARFGTLMAATDYDNLTMAQLRKLYAYTPKPPVKAVPPSTIEARVDRMESILAAIATKLGI